MSQHMHKLCWIPPLHLPQYNVKNFPCYFIVNADQTSSFNHAKTKQVHIRLIKVNIWLDLGYLRRMVAYSWDVNWGKVESTWVHQSYLIWYEYFAWTEDSIYQTFVLEIQ